MYDYTICYVRYSYTIYYILQIILYHNDTPRQYVCRRTWRQHSRSSGTMRRTSSACRRAPWWPISRPVGPLLGPFWGLERGF